MYYDLHAHILPGVDDGARTPEDTLEMARVAAQNGTSTILATPHRKDVNENWSVGYVRDLVAEMGRQVRGQGVELDLLLGMENHLDLELPDAVIQGKALPMNGTRYILVELPFFGNPNYVEDVLFKLQLQGLVPVLAHPERIELVQKDPERLAEFVRRGMLSQITAGSILGHFGGRVQQFTHMLLRRGLAHIIASDTHFPDGPRSPRLPPGVEAAASIVGEERARAMVVDIPRAILKDEPVEVEPPLEGEQSRRWWQFWRGG